jgi:hypothetical protein
MRRETTARERRLKVIAECVRSSGRRVDHVHYTGELERPVQNLSYDAKDVICLPRVLCWDKKLSKYRHTSPAHHRTLQRVR